jgi:hypothetical protein
MPESFLKNTLQELIERWSKANFQYELIAVAEKDIKLSLYSTHDLYDFSEYAESNVWQSEDWLMPTIPEHYLFYEYFYSADNTPLLVKKYHNGVIGSIGIFLWHEDQWEYIEFNALVLICSAYHSIRFKDGKKDLFVSLRLNGGTFQYGSDSISATEIARKLSEDHHGFFAEVNRYNYENNRIITADSLSNIPGIGEYFTTDHYAYNSTGELYKITAHNLKGEKQIIYITLSDRSVNKLIKSVAIQMANHLISSIAQAGFKQTLNCVVISYQYCYSYWPSFSLISEAEMSDDVNAKAVIFPMGQFYSNAEFHNHAPEKLLEDFAELEQHISQKDKQELGRKMLIETAKIMTTSRLKKAVPVTNDFLTFPIDWTLHSPPEAKLLKACGAGDPQIKLWRDLRWID